MRFWPGEPGVGKTAVAEALAQRIVDKDVPAGLMGRVFSLDMGALIAGTTSRGDYEEVCAAFELRDTSAHANPTA